jgi:thioredoxin-related protein
MKAPITIPLILTVLLLLFNYSSYSQENKGISFVTDLSWPEILQKAKSESKYIFIDAFATWCIPCRRMDQTVYVDTAISTYINSQFISVKIQMDTTGQDSPFIKSWRKDASTIKQKYKIASFPSFIFLTPNGEISHMGVGYLKTSDFRNLAEEAINPKTSFGGQIALFKAKSMPPNKMLELALLATHRYHQDSMANIIAKTYKDEYLVSNLSQDILSPKLPDFLNTFYQLFSFKDHLIKYMYQHTAKLDSIAKWDGFSSGYIDFIINRDWIYSQIKPKGTWVIEAPKWEPLKQHIAQDFNIKISSRLILSAQIAWYTQKKNWKMVAQLGIQKADAIDLHNADWGFRSDVNSMVYNILFKYSDDQLFLNKGIGYMKTITAMDSNNYAQRDTYACILYKAGQIKEGIQQEVIALGLAQNAKDKDSIKDFGEKLVKMKANMSIWNVE